MKRLLCIFLTVCCLLGGCAKEYSPVEKSLWAMDTYMELRIWGRDAAEGADDIETMLRELERKWSVTGSGLLARMNGGEEVSLEEADAALLARLEALSRRTGGAFDPRLHSVSQAWGFYNGQYRVPRQSEIDEALSEKQWDLGAALKGYAGQEAARMLAERQVERAVLSLGGNIQTYGEKPDGTPWGIAIANPFGGDPVGTIHVSGTASIVTSGSYQRYFEKNGVRYHHILNPQTGYPADSGLVSVTVISRDGLTADALSTALFVMGLERGSTLWRESDDFEAVFILTDGKIYATEGANLRGCEYEVIAR